MTTPNIQMPTPKCPVCETTNLIEGQPTLLCAQCGWEFLFWGQAIPTDLSNCVAQQIQIQKQFYHQIAALERKKKEQLPIQQALAENVQQRKQAVQTAETDFKTVTTALNELQSQLKVESNQKEAILKLQKWLEAQPATHEVFEDELYCRYVEGKIEVVCQHDWDADDLPRLVLGIDLNNDFQLVTQAEIVYLLPRPDAFTKQLHREGVCWTCASPVPLPPKAFYKFGIYQKKERLFNIITQ
jgi:hypothetical protein